jgi:ligand-binding sensor domain-containing protein
MNIFKSLFFLTILIFSYGVNAQDWVSYQSAQQINDLVDNGSELIMATDAGLVVMNKSTLEKTTYNTSNSNLDHNQINAITQASNGDIYFVTDVVSLGIYDGEDFKDVKIPESVITNINTMQLLDVEVAANGDLWVGTSEGIISRQGQNWAKYDKTDLGEFFRVWDVEIDSDGDVFVGAQNGVHKFENDSWSHISKNDSIEGYRNAELFFSKSGDLFFGGDLTKTARYDGTNWEIYNQGSGGDRMQFVEDKDSNVYMNLASSIFQLENNTWKTYTDSQTLAMDDIIVNEDSYYYIDTQNQRWFCKNIYLSVSDKGTIRSTSIFSNNTIEANSIKGIHKGRNGKLFFRMGRTSTGSIAVVDPKGNWSSLELPDSLTRINGIYDILFLADDDIWLTSYEGLHHYDGKKWSSNELVLGFQSKLATNSLGKIYVLASKRIYIVENGNVSEFTPTNSPLSDLEVTSSLGIDANDNLWIASYDWSGNSKIQKVDNDGKWTAFDHTNHPSIDQPAGDFHFDKNGNIWISAKVGAIKFDGENFTNPIKENISNLENYKASSIESDSEGRMYFAHQYGVTTLLDSVWGELLIDDVPHKKTSANTNIKFDDAGTLWWASNFSGVYAYTPATTASIFSSIERTTDFSIYPNPSKGTINFSTKHIGNSSIKIYNRIGELVYTNDNLNTNSPLQLNQSPGIYVLVLETNNSTSAIKFILQ